MISSHKVIAIIPARGGSKGVPRKNIRNLAGKPPIAWTIATARQCSQLDRVLVSTDDVEIAAIAQTFGAEVPFLRPEELARDDTSDLPVYEHALTWLAVNGGSYPDIVAWLRPTSPLRHVADIQAAMELLVATQADWVRSVVLPKHPPYWAKRLDGDRLVGLVDNWDDEKYNCRRQALPKAYIPNGAVDVTWSKTIIEKKLLYLGDVRGYVMPAERSIDLDSELDFIMAELLLQREGHFERLPSDWQPARRAAAAVFYHC